MRNDQDWKKELKEIIDKGCADSRIEDFANSHPEIKGTDIWKFHDYVLAPDACKGCVHMRECGPLTECSRRHHMKDMFEERPYSDFKNGDEVEFVPECPDVGRGVITEKNSPGRAFCRVRFTSGMNAGKEMIVFSNMLRRIDAGAVDPAQSAGGKGGKK